MVRILFPRNLDSNKCNRENHYLQTGCIRACIKAKAFGSLTKELSNLENFTPIAKAKVVVPCLDVR